ncbi:MAG: hypothetical protein AAFY15_09440 [Cyanobacteria bacterium J06648_11]
MNPQRILDRFVAIYGWEGRHTHLFDVPTLSVYVGLQRLTVIPVAATDLKQMVERDAFPATWDFVHGQIILAIAGRLDPADYPTVWQRLRRSTLIDLWIENDMRAIAADNAATALKTAGIFLLLPD